MLCVCSCTTRSLLLDIDDPKKLVRSRWRWFSPRCYVAYRVILALYTLTILCLSISKTPNYVFIFLTTWGYVCLTLNFMVKAFIVVRYYHWLKHEIEGDNSESESGGDDSEQIQLLRSENYPDTSNDLSPGLPILLQFSWLLSTVASTVGVTISVIYWSYLFPNSHEPFSFGTFQAHGFNSVLIIIDLLVGLKPHRVVHVYQPVSFALLYVAFNGIYWACGGTTPFGTKAIYPILDWDNSQKTGIGVSICLVLLGVMHACLSGIAKLRDFGIKI